MTIPRTLDGQIAELVYRDAEIARRGRNRRRTGKVAEGPDDQGRYRVDMTKKGSEHPFISDWIKPRPLGAGKVKIDVILKKGEQVDVFSESGDMTDARIEMSDYSDDNPRENDGAPLHIKVDGDYVIIASRVRITGDVEIAGKLDITGSGVTHNGKDIGDTHRHMDVTPGPDFTGAPA